MAGWGRGFIVKISFLNWGAINGVEFKGFISQYVTSCCADEEKASAVICHKGRLPSIGHMGGEIVRNYIKLN